jgi:hypothetical protein
MMRLGWLEMSLAGCSKAGQWGQQQALGRQQNAETFE